MSILILGSNFGSRYINFPNPKWRKITVFVLCFLLAFGQHPPASGTVLSDRALGSIVGFGLGEASEATVHGAAGATPGKDYQPSSVNPELAESNQPGPALAEEQVSLPSEGEPAAAEISYSAASPESSSISSEDHSANGTSVSAGETTTSGMTTAQEEPGEAIKPIPTETTHPQVSQEQQRQEQPSEAIKPKTDSMILQSSAYTCGPAALATLLKKIGGGANYYRQISELAQAGQNGTSLLALRRSAETLGYRAAGYKLNIKELVAAGPMLAHVVIGGYHHFTVVEGIAGESVFLADPQLGRVSIPIEQFESVWSGAVLKILEAGPAEAAPDAKERYKTNEVPKHQVAPASTESVGQVLTDGDVASLQEDAAPEAQEAAVEERSPATTTYADHTPKGMPESTVMLPEITGGSFSSSRPLDETEMAETKGRGLFLVGLAAAKVAIMVAPKILPFAVRVINNPKTQHTILQTRNTGRHLVQIGVDRWGRHVGFGANRMNQATARWHIYQNSPGRINPRR